MLRSTSAPIAGGLVRPSRGIQIRCERGKVSVTDGPFAETKELIDGFALVEVASREEAIRMASESAEVRRAIAQLWRAESARITAGLVRIVRDVAVAEELAQDALVAALEQWPITGMPDNPAAWLTTTAKNRALTALRRSVLAQRTGETIAQEAERDAAHPSAAIEAAMDDDVGDDVLRLIFIACHPVLAQESRVALTLRMVGGLTTDEIARAFLVSEPAIAQRIVRAKRVLSAARVPFELPRGDQLAPRLGSVLEVVYLIFNEGYSASAGADLLRIDLCDEALRLGRRLAELAPGEPEVHGLLALMKLQASRAATRVDAAGEPVLLADQDRVTTAPRACRS